MAKAKELLSQVLSSLPGQPLMLSMIYSKSGWHLFKMQTRLKGSGCVQTGFLMLNFKKLWPESWKFRSAIKTGMLKESY